MSSGKIYIVISHYFMQDDDFGMSIFSNKELAIREAQSESNRLYTKYVDVFECDHADRYFFGKLISNFKK